MIIISLEISGPINPQNGSKWSHQALTNSKTVILDLSNVCFTSPGKALTDDDCYKEDNYLTDQSVYQLILSRVTSKAFICLYLISYV